MSLSARVTKLEQAGMPRPPYVVRISGQQTAQDAEAIATARRHGYSFAVLPFKCRTVAEWSARNSAEARR